MPESATDTSIISVDAASGWLPAEESARREHSPSRLVKLLAELAGEERMGRAVDMELRNQPGAPPPRPGSVRASLIDELAAVGAPPSDFGSVWTAWLKQDPTYGVPTPIKDRGGHVPDKHEVHADPATGFMYIMTVIESESSNLRSLSALDRSIPVMYSAGTISLSPIIGWLRVWHPLYGEWGGSYSEGHIGVLLRSFDDQGGDEVLEAKDEQEIWRARYSGGISPGDARGFDDEPHIQDMITMGKLRVATLIRPNRKYHATVYIRSDSDADGNSGLFNTAAAGVLFQGQLSGIFVREERWP